MAYDLFGREVNGGESMTTGGAASALLGSVKTVVETKAPGTEAAINRLYEAVNNFATKFDPRASGDRDNSALLIQKVVDLQNEMRRTPSEKSSAKDDRRDALESKAIQKMADATTKLWHASQKQNTIWFGVAKFSTRAQKQIAESIKLAGCCGALKSAKIPSSAPGGGKDVVSLLGSTGGGGKKGGAMLPPMGGGGGGGGGGGAMLPPGGGGGGKAAAAGAILGAATALLQQFVAIHKMMVAAVDLDPFKHIFTGAISGSNDFRENLRQTIHQTVGFGDANREIEESYRNITSAVAATGVRRGEFQKVWLQNLQRGLSFESADDKRWAKRLNAEERETKGRARSVGRMMSITTSALNTAQQLGMDVNVINDLFMDWHMHLGLSANEMAQMGREMQNVARNTGLTGKQLEQAVKSADKIMRSLKSAGGASVAAGRNVMELTALMQRHGVSEQGGQVMQALSSRSSFFAASPEMRSMLSRVGMAGGPGLTNAIMSGNVLTNRAQTRQLGEGMDKEVRSFMQNFAGDFARLGVEMPRDLTQLSDTIQQLRQKGPEGERMAGVLDQQMRNRFAGMGVGDVEQMMKVFREQGMTTGERITDITSRMSEMQRQGRTGLAEYQRLQNQLLETQTGQSMSAFTTLETEMRQRGVQSFNDLSAEARQQIQNRLAEEMGADNAASFMNNIGGSASELLDNLSKRAKAQGQDLGQLLRDRGTSMEDIQQQLAQGGDAAQTALMQLNEAQQEVSRRERAAQDPVTQIRDTLTQMNNRLGGWLDSVGFGMGEIVTKILYVGGIISSFLVEILIALGTLSMLKSFFGMGGTMSSMIGGTGVGTLSGATASSLAAVLGPVAAGLMLVGGAVKGAMEAEENNRTTGEGILLGALTGGAGTGSMFSEWFGIEKGSDGDKAMGVGTAALWGGAIGALLAPLTGGLSIPIGMLVGALFEWLKIVTEGTDFIQRYIIRPFEGLVVGLWEVLKGVWDIVAGIFTLDGERIIEGIKKIIGGIMHYNMELLKWALDVVISTILNIPTLLLNAIKWVFLELPNWIFNQITAGLQALADNEYVGAIFQPILELWTSIKDIWDQLYDFIKPILDSLLAAWAEVKNAIYSLIGPLLEAGGEGSFLSGVFKVLGGVIKTLAAIIGFVLKVVLWPFITAFKIIGAVVGWVIAKLQPVIDWFKMVISVVWDILKKIGKIFYYIGAIAGVLLGKAFEWVGKKLTEFGQWFMGVWNKIVTFLEPVLTPVIDALTWLGKGLLWLVETALWPIWEVIKFIGDIIAGVIQIISETVGSILGFFENLYNVLVGNSIVPDLIYGIINFFLMLPIRILAALAEMGLNMVTSILGWLWEIPKAFLNMVNDMLGGVPGAILDSVLGGLTSVFGGLIDFLKGALGGLIDFVGGAIEGFGETNAQADARIAEEGYSTSHGLGRTAGGLWDTLSGGDAGFFSLSGRWEGIKKTFGGAFETVAGVATGIWDMAKGAWDGIGSVLGGAWESVSGFFGGISDTFGEWTSGIGGILGGAWEGVSGFFGSAIDGLGSFLGNAAEGIGGFFTDLWEDPGATIGGVIDDAGDMLSSVGDAVVGGLSSVGSAIAESPINPLNWFQEGTREVEQGGLAVLHPGEMIIPMSVWEQIKAIGSGAFGSGGGIVDSFSNIFGGIGSMLTGGGAAETSGGGWWSSLTDWLGFGSGSGTGAPVEAQITESLPSASSGIIYVEDVYVASILKDILTNMMAPVSVEADPATLGAFEADQPTEAIESAMSEKVNSGSWLSNWIDRLMGGNLSDMASSAYSGLSTITGANQSGQGLFDGGNIFDLFSNGLNYIASTASDVYNGSNPVEAMQKNMGLFDPDNVGEALNNNLSSAIDTRPDRQRVSNIVAQVSDALAYGQEASSTANDAMASQFGDVSGTTGDITSMPLDYSDELRGEVSTLGLSRAGIESRLERERYGEQGSGTAVVPSMDAIGDYLLTEQSAYFRDMIDLLSSIDNKMSFRSGSSEVIGKTGGGLPSAGRPGIKNIARDMTRGYWDLTFGDMSSGNVTTEGRGGSA